MYKRYGQIEKRKERETERMKMNGGEEGESGRPKKRQGKKREN